MQLGPRGAAVTLVCRRVRRSPAVKSGRPRGARPPRPPASGLAAALGAGANAIPAPRGPRAVAAILADEPLGRLPVSLVRFCAPRAPAASLAPLRRVVPSSRSVSVHAPAFESPIRGSSPDTSIDRPPPHFTLFRGFQKYSSPN